MTIRGDPDDHRSLTEDEVWLLSFYRVSEISGSLLFGRLASTLRAGPVQADMTRHFADEAQHAWYWTSCLQDLGARPLKVEACYQDRYLESAGLPANLMEILALTQVFERRVIGQYVLHARAASLPARVGSTLARIGADERWHISWVRKALLGLEGEYGRDHIAATLRRYGEADREVYRQVLDEHAGRVARLANVLPGR